MVRVRLNTFIVIKSKPQQNLPNYAHVDSITEIERPAFHDGSYLRFPRMNDLGQWQLARTRSRASSTAHWLACSASFRLLVTPSVLLAMTNISQRNSMLGSIAWLFPKQLILNNYFPNNHPPPNQSYSTKNPNYNIYNIVFFFFFGIIYILIAFQKHYNGSQKN